MSGKIDLHTHSIASDGSMHPAELVRYAKQKGLLALALTDHDTIDGVQEALCEGQRVGIEVVPGVEISVDFDPEMHILGYFLNENYHDIGNILASLKKEREVRNPKIVRKLNEMGFDITMEEVRRESRGTLLGRSHIASAMCRKGYTLSMEEAFHKYLASGKAAYIKRDKLSPEKGIKEIEKAGGIPVLAHPIYLHMSIDELDRLLAMLKDYGLKGIEAYYVDNTIEDTENLLKLAEKQGLIVTGGSDFHGKFKKDIDLGNGRGNLEVPYSLLEKLKQL